MGELCDAGQEADFRGENCDGRPVERGASARGGVQLHLRSHAMRVSTRNEGGRGADEHDGNNWHPSTDRDPHLPDEENARAICRRQT